MDSEYSMVSIPESVTRRFSFVAAMICNIPIHSRVDKIIWSPHNKSCIFSITSCYNVLREKRPCVPSLEQCCME